MPGALPPHYQREVLEKIFQERSLPPAAHAGLVFDRYLRIWQETVGARKAISIERPLQEFVDEFNRRNTDDAPAVALLREVNERLSRLHDSSSHLPLPARRYQIAWRLTSGLGGSHPLENGFCFDPTAGVPIIAGSGIKGLCREVARLDGLAETTQIALFGSEQKEEDADDETLERGDLLFFDAYPAAWPKLAVDVINCHHPDYYADRTAQCPPVTWESPVPVFFLTVDAGTEFVFRIGSVGRIDGNIDEAFHLLDRGLAILGLGAKTAVGYGLLTRVG